MLFAWPSSIGIPPSEHMVPGEVYIGIPPGHTRPAFVRKRLPDAGRPPCPSKIFKMFCPSSWGRRHRCYNPYPHGTYYTDRYNPQVSFAAPGVIHDTPRGPVAAGVKHFCPGCGKYRSARFHSQHPLAPGEGSSSKLCRKCRHKHTSSEDSEPICHKRHQYHHSRYSTTSSDDSYYEHYPRSRLRSRRRSSSRGSVNVIVDNQAEAYNGHNGRVRDRLSSSSTDGVRIIHREEVTEVPRRRLSLPRSRIRTLSEISNAIFDEPSYHSRPRSSSRVRYVDELDTPRHGSRVRSTSRVSVVEPNEPTIISSSRRRLSRRRSRRRFIHFDGAADTGTSEDESRGRSRHRRQDPVLNSEQAIQPVEDVFPGPHLQALRSIEPSSGPQATGEPEITGEPELTGDPEPIVEPEQIEETPSPCNSDQQASASSERRSRPSRAHHVTVESISRSRSAQRHDDSTDNGDHHRSTRFDRDQKSPERECNNEELPPSPPRPQRRRYRGSGSSPDPKWDSKNFAPPKSQEIRVPLPFTPRLHPDVVARMVKDAYDTAFPADPNDPNRHKYERFYRNDFPRSPSLRSTGSYTPIPSPEPYDARPESFRRSAPPMFSQFGSYCEPTGTQAYTGAYGWMS